MENNDNSNDPEIIENEKLQDKIISENKNTGKIYLDISSKSLKTLSNKILSLSHLEFLYLKKNLIEILPNEIFLMLPQLKYLDLRFNNLQSLPQNSHLGNHQYLQTLLLSRNHISELPVTLGINKSLETIHLDENPIIFPKPRVIDKGSEFILQYLRKKFENSSASENQQNLNYDSDSSNESDHSLANGNGAGNIQYDGIADLYDSVSENREIPLRSSALTNHLKKFDKSSGNHPQRSESLTVSNSIAEQITSLENMNTRRKSSNLNQAFAKSKLLSVNKNPNQINPAAQLASSLKSTESLLNSEPISIDKLHENLQYTRKIEKQRQKNKKIESILQKRRDVQAVDNWRQRAKQMQHSKRSQFNFKTNDQIKHESENRILNAPIKTNPLQLEILGSEELNFQKQKNLRPDEKPKKLPAELIQMREMQRIKEEHELELKIVQHSEHLKRKNQINRNEKSAKSKNDLFEAEMDLKLALELHRQLRMQKENYLNKN